MSRSVSLTLRQAANAPETGEVFLVLLTIDHPDLPVPLRVSSDGVDTLSRGETFVACPFGLTLPDDGDERPPKARLTIDNVDRAIVKAVRGITTAPRVLIEVVLASDPDLVEASFPDFELQEARFDALTVEGELGLESFFREPYPAQRFTPAGFPGLF